MNEPHVEFLREKLTEEHFDKLMRLNNPKLHRFVAESLELCQPASVFVCTDSDEDVHYIRREAVATGEEKPLAIAGHTVHFDGFHDQARDKERTKYLVPSGVDLGANLNAIDREEGLAEIKGILKGIMSGRRMIVRFFCLAPADSEFLIAAVQLTDSFYVAHSEDLLYRPGYEQFKRIGDSEDYFRILHSAGELVDGVSANIDKRRIYIDIQDDIVFSANTQYAGNTVGCKKLSLRMAIRKADREGWLAEHMLVMGAHGPDGRVTYFTGAFPSGCGKTATSMIPNETIVGDDLAYLRKIDGQVRAVNVESGIFGIIRNVNAEDDPLIWDSITNTGEVIFSNVLVADGKPCWLGDGREVPDRGVNFSGPWYEGKTDANGNEVPPAHPNARYTIRLSALDNRDEKADDPAGVPLGGVVYGGRDSDTSVPVQQSFDWTHGVITMGASLESLTTATTLGQQGVRAFQPMSNLDFVSIPLGKYITNHLDFAKGIDEIPLIFAVNYYIKGPDGGYLNGMTDKYVWLKWMERRVHGELDVLRTPTGFIPRYDDLRVLFHKTLQKTYTSEEYEEQFALRIPENIHKIDRVVNIYRTKVPDAPQILFDVLAEQHRRLQDAREAHGDYVSPFDLG